MIFLLSGPAVKVNKYGTGRAGPRSLRRGNTAERESVPLVIFPGPRASGGKPDKNCILPCFAGAGMVYFIYLFQPFRLTIYMTEGLC